MIACLGSWNYWTTLPFMTVFAVVAALGVVFPQWLRFWPVPMWARRAIAAVLLVGVVAVAIPSALREARNNPDCVTTESI